MAFLSDRRDRRRSFWRRRPVLTAQFVLGALMLTVGAGLRLGDIYVNSSGSIPMGFYRAASQSGLTAKTGDYVLFCPPLTPLFEEAHTRGYLGSGVCPGRFGYLMKRVAAASGDLVEFSESGVRVNDRMLQRSQRLSADRDGRLLWSPEQMKQLLEEHQVLLMSDNTSLGFDGRYFGPIARMQIKTVLVPVWVW